jgi:hypothetical protein
LARDKSAVKPPSGTHAKGNKPKGKTPTHPANKPKSKTPLPKGSTTTPAQVDAPARADAGVAQRTRAALEREANNTYQQIEVIKEHRIDAWNHNIEIPDKKPDNTILEIVIAIVAEGMGGVVYGLVDEMLAQEKAGLGHHLVQEFFALAGLEAGDLATEAFFRNSLISARDALHIANVSASDEKSVQEAITGALKTGNNPIEFYIEAVKNQALAEQVVGQHDFNTQAPTMSDEKVAGRYAAQAQIYNKLAKDKDVFQRELTVGYLRMLKELDLKYERGGATEANMWGAWPNPGEVTLVASPTYPNNVPMRPGSARPWSVGSYTNPIDVKFDGFEARAKIINASTLENLTGARVSELSKLTLVFYLLGANPYQGFMEGSTVPLVFRRDASGRFRVDRMGSDEPLEWFASFATQEDREHTDEELEKLAPVGAEQLYKLVTDKVITATQILN